MKLALALSMLIGLTQGALAKDPDCRSLDSTGARLACYDAAFPPTLKMPAAKTSAASRDTYIDPFVAEEAKTAAKLKNICRGC
jgi:hypothetical protein